MPVWCSGVGVCCNAVWYRTTDVCRWWRCCKQIKTMHGRGGVETAITGDVGGGGGGGVLAVTRHISLAWGCWESSQSSSHGWPGLAGFHFPPSMH